MLSAAHVGEAASRRLAPAGCRAAPLPPRCHCVPAQLAGCMGGTGRVLHMPHRLAAFRRRSARRRYG